MSRILQDIRHKIGPSGDYDYFDRDILDAINEAFATLTQLGVKPKEGFQVVDNSTDWNDYTEDITLQNLVRSYVFKKVQLLFDTPNNLSHTEVIKEKLAEYEWRINVWVDPKDGGNDV